LNLLFFFFVHGVSPLSTVVDINFILLLLPPIITDVPSASESVRQISKKSLSADVPSASAFHQRLTDFREKASLI